MGFGHYRIAYAATSWGVGDTTRAVYFHDLLNIESEEANMIQDTDKMYSKFTRIASEWGGPIEKLWGSLTPKKHPQRACSKNLQMNKIEQKECSLWWQAGAPKF
jgi:hypothetical protein